MNYILTTQFNSSMSLKIMSDWKGKLSRSKSTKSPKSIAIITECNEISSAAAWQAVILHTTSFSTISSNYERDPKKTTIPKKLMAATTSFQHLQEPPKTEWKSFNLNTHLTKNKNWKNSKYISSSQAE